MVSSPAMRVGAAVRASLIAAVVIAGTLVAGPLFGCDGGSSSGAKGDEKAAAPPAEPQRRLPTLAFPTEIRAPYPEVSAFLDEFLNTCLVGDYAGYRRMVGRAHTPESRERFEAIYQVTEGVVVESIEKIENERLPGGIYRVVSTIDLDPKLKVKLRETQRKVAILVFKEGENWRMGPAPPELQPRDEPPPVTTTSAPTTSAPAYPWDEDGDY